MTDFVKKHKFRQKKTQDFFRFYNVNFLLKLRSISKFQYKTWLSMLPLRSGIHNLLVVWQVWAWRAIFQKWWILSKSVTSNKKHQFLKFDIIGIWCALHIKNCAWVDLRFGMSYKSVAKTVNFWWFFSQMECFWSAWTEKGQFYQFLDVDYKKLCVFFVKISTLKWSAYPSSPFWYQLQVDRQCGSVVA